MSGSHDRALGRTRSDCIGRVRRENHVASTGAGADPVAAAPGPARHTRAGCSADIQLSKSTRCGESRAPSHTSSHNADTSSRLPLCFLLSFTTTPMPESHVLYFGVPHDPWFGRLPHEATPTVGLVLAYGHTLRVWAIEPKSQPISQAWLAMALHGLEAMRPYSLDVTHPPTPSSTLQLGRRGSLRPVL